jgi:anti-anti-sigma regulatory factor
VLRTNFKNAITTLRDGNNVLINLNKDIYFMNKSQIKETLLSLKEGDEVYIDGTKAKFIDHDIFSILLEFKRNAKRKKIDVDFKNVSKNNKENINQFEDDLNEK